MTLSQTVISSVMRAHVQAMNAYREGPNVDCQISYRDGLGMSRCIMGLTTQNPYIQKEPRDINLKNKRHKACEIFLTVSILKRSIVSNYERSNKTKRYIPMV